LPTRELPLIASLIWSVSFNQFLSEAIDRPFHDPSDDGADAKLGKLFDSFRPSKLFRVGTLPEF